MTIQPSLKGSSAPPAAAGAPQGRPDGDCHPASRSEAARALEQKRRVYARESLDGGWGQVAAIEELLDQGRRTPAWTVRFVSGRARAALDGDFLVEREAPSA